PATAAGDRYRRQDMSLARVSGANPAQWCRYGHAYKAHKVATEVSQAGGSASHQKMLEGAEQVTNIGGIPRITTSAAGIFPTIAVNMAGPAARSGWALRSRAGAGPGASQVRGRRMR